MSTGFKNKNYGNINYNGIDWEGATGNFSITADGEKNIVFQNPVYGIRALMVILSNYISKYGIYNISDIIRRYSPAMSESENISRSTTIANKYFNGANPQDDILDLSDKTIIGLTKGIIEGEIPEWKQIPAQYYDAALRYYNSGDDTEAQQYNSLSPVAGSFGLVFIILFAAAGYYFLRKK